MRIEFIDTITGKTGAKELPPLLNPIRVGQHPKNHVQLDHPGVGAETFAIDNDVVRGEGWRLWNRNGREIRVGDVVLTERNQFVRLTESRVVVACEPFVLTLYFAPEEREERLESNRLDRRCANLVREVHKALIDLHPHDPEERGEWLRDEYVHRLEQEIAELAAARVDFSADNLSTSELAAYVAGVAVRSALIHTLTTRVASREADSARVRIAIPELEAELTSLVEVVRTALGLDGDSTLTEQVGAVDAGFWGFWQRLTVERRIAPRVLRYLALRRLTEEVKDVWYGFGPLEDLLDDPTINEIMVVSAEKIFVEKQGRTERSGRQFFTDPLITIQRVMARANREINTGRPFADARMPDGSRVNAIIPPLALSGPCLTIRRFPSRPLTMQQLVNEHRTLSPSACDFLQAAVVGRRNVVVSGGTGTGKTTLLNCLSGFIPDRERIVTIEDTAELQLQKEHVITLQARPINGEGAGEVTIRDLVRNALRMRPDRIVVGECRGGEALDMLQAMNTGHDGSMTTLHANEPRSAIERLVVLVQMAAGSQLPVSAILQQIASALDLIVQLNEVIEDGRRRRIVSQIAEVVGYDPEEQTVRIVPLFHADHAGPLTATGCLPSFLPDLILRGLVPDPIAFVRDVG